MGAQFRSAQKGAIVSAISVQVGLELGSRSWDTWDMGGQESNDKSSLDSSHQSAGRGSG